MAYFNGKKILNVEFDGIVNIDQHYDPESENPQSGTAVAEALETIGGGGSGNTDVDQSYNPESENPQSGVAVAGAVNIKANLEYKDLPIDIFASAEVGIEGTGVYILNEFYPVLTVDKGTLYSLVFGNSDVRLVVGDPVTSTEYFEEIGFIIGRKYEIKMSLNSYGEPLIVDSVRAILDLEDKVNITDFEEAMANVGGGGEDMYELIETIEVTESTTIKRSEEPDGTPYNFKSVILRIETTATDFATSRWFFRYIEPDKPIIDIFAHDFAAFSNKTQKQRSWCELSLDRGLWIASQIAWTQYTGYQNVQKSGILFNKTIEDAPSINYILSSGTTAGTIVEIWGVRA